MICYSHLQPAQGSTSIALGFFDGVHRGHQNVLHAALQAADQNHLTPGVFYLYFGQPKAQIQAAKPTAAQSGRAASKTRGNGICLLLAAWFWRISSTDSHSVCEANFTGYHAGQVRLLRGKLSFRRQCGRRRRVVGISLRLVRHKGRDCSHLCGKTGSR